MERTELNLQSARLKRSASMLAMTAALALLPANTALADDIRPPQSGGQLWVKAREYVNLAYDPAFNTYGRGETELKVVDGVTHALVECSHFVKYVMRDTYDNVTESTVDQLAGEGQFPNAGMWHDAIVAENSTADSNGVPDAIRLHHRDTWRTAQGAIRPTRGDIIAMKYKSDSDTSGHMGIIEEVRDASTPGSFGHDNTKQQYAQYAVRIVDSARSQHGGDDTRLNYPANDRDGIGSGWIRVYVDKKTHQSVAWMWNLGTESIFRENPIAVGWIEVD